MLFCSRSAFFKAARSGNWKEAQEKQIQLPGKRAIFFRVNFESVYDRVTDLSGLAYAVVNEGYITWDDPEIKPGSVVLHVLCELWILGDYLGEVKFKNELVDTMYKLYKEGHNVLTSTLSEIFAKTHSQCDFQKFWVKCFVRSAFGSNSKHTPVSVLEQCGTAFSLALVKTLFEKRDAGLLSVRPTDLTPNISEYHEHGEDEEECKREALREDMGM